MEKEDENKVSIDKSYYEDLLKNNQRPGESYNMFAALAAAAPAAVIGVDAFIKRNEAKTSLEKQQGYVDTLMKQYMDQPIYNPYDNLSVATQANQIKMEETDKALANTLDTLRAQGEIMVQNAEMQRKGQQMDYEQSKADQLRTEQFAYGERASDMAGALGSLGLQAARGLGSGKNKKSDTAGMTVDATVDATVDTTESNFVENDQYSPNFTSNPDMDTLEIADPPQMYQERDAFGNTVRPVDYNFLQNPGVPSFDPSFGNSNDEAHQKTLSKMEKIKLDRMTQEERAKYLTQQYIGTKF